MASPLIECVPNVSEGRRREVIDALARAVRGVGGTRLLDVSADPDHNRVVLTFVGSAAAVADAAQQCAEVAVARIDLRTHEGVHPRIGAVDVIPFVPLFDASLAECIELADRLGRDLASRLDLPVYLYAAAARTPSRRALVEIRRGGFEGLRDTIARPDRRPDFGPPRVHPTAGAVAVGARDVLIAFNVNLLSADLRAARTIARAVRESSGGLPAVQAMGVPLPSRGVVQVSMNLFDYHTTSLQAAFDRVVSESARMSIEVLDSELIGCAPREALPSDPLAALRLRGLRPGQILDPPRLAGEMAPGQARGGAP
jgi:glutamate formiminotransferase